MKYSKSVSSLAVVGLSAALVLSACSSGQSSAPSPSASATAAISRQAGVVVATQVCFKNHTAGDVTVEFTRSVQQPAQTTQVIRPPQGWCSSVIREPLKTDEYGTLTFSDGSVVNWAVNNPFIGCIGFSVEGTKMCVDDASSARAELVSGEHVFREISSQEGSGSGGNSDYQVWNVEIVR